ncbi:hypothetical protein JJB98_18670 [Bradyrhizobium diazoefficiens]|nr:hypothetical protein [Bradyrhizobium diazoefficiens]QQO21817.1 hypothetical protein JJB98_18670 [Bradyrhizobium diazoefficiens]
MIIHQRDLPTEQTQDSRLRCPSCAAFPPLTEKFLNPRDGKTVRLYQCDCGEHIWLD